ncbi:MAG: thiamine phosphate synthase [Luteolibacter sp.]
MASADMSRAERRERLGNARLYGIVDFGYVAEADVSSMTEGLLKGGADVIQLRAKGIDLETVEKAAREMVPLCREAGVPFILNDYPEMAVEVGADGVHVGQDDGDLEDVRKIVREGMLIGRSTHSLSQAKQAMADGADCIGFGPLFPTPTKAGRPAIGLKEISPMEKEVGAYLPAFCIGGINPENLEAVLSAGGQRVVIVSYLLTATDVKVAAEGIKKEFLRDDVMVKP